MSDFAEELEIQDIIYSKFNFVAVPGKKDVGRIIGDDGE